MSYAIKIFHNLSVQQSNYHTLSALGDPMYCCFKPSASANSVYSHTKHLGGIDLTIVQKGVKQLVVYGFVRLFLTITRDHKKNI